MSPRAACRLERFGFTDVYDYTAGIADWKAAGLATEGTEDIPLTVADAMRTDIPTCRPEELIRVAKERALRGGWGECLVIDCGSVVVGRLRNEAWQANEGDSVEHVMEVGPTTVRGDADLASLVERMDRRGTQLVTITNPQGQLLGVVTITDAHRVVGGAATTHEWHECDGCPGQRRAIAEPHNGADRAE